MIMSLPVYRSSFDDHHSQRQLGNYSQSIVSMLMPSRNAWSEQRYHPMITGPQASRHGCADCDIQISPVRQVSTVTCKLVTHSNHSRGAIMSS